MQQYEISVSTLSPKIHARMQTEIAKLLATMEDVASDPADKRALSFAIRSIKTGRTSCPL